MSDAAQPTQTTQTTQSTPDATTEVPRSALRLVRGDAAPEELAALVAVLAARGSDAGAPAAPVQLRGRWGDPATALRGRLDPGPGAWRASAR